MSTSTVCPHWFASLLSRIWKAEFSLCFRLKQSVVSAVLYSFRYLSRCPSPKRARYLRLRSRRVLYQHLFYSFIEYHIPFYSSLSSIFNSRCMQFSGRVSFLQQVSLQGLRAYLSEDVPTPLLHLFMRYRFLQTMPG